MSARDLPDHRPGTSWVRWRVFGLAWLVVVVNFVDRSAISVAMPRISDEFSMGPEVQGLVLSAFFWTYLLFQVPGGWLLDRFGPRRVIAGAGVVWGAFQVAGAGVVGTGTLLLTRLGLGAGEAPMYPAGAKLNAAWIPARERGRAATFYDAGGPLGAAIGGVVVTSILAVTGSWRLAFVITGLLTILLSAAVWWYLRDDPAQHRAVAQDELALVREGGEAQQADADAGPLPSVRDYAASRSFWALFAGRLGWSLVWWGLITWTPQYLADDRGVDLLALGAGSFLIYGAGFVGEVVAGVLMDRARQRARRVGRAVKLLLAVSGALAIGCLVAVPSAPSTAAAVALLAGGVLTIAFGGIYWAFPAWLAPTSQVGRVGSVMNIASSGGGVLAPVVIGALVGASGFGAAFLFLAACGVLYLVGSSLIDFSRPLATARATSSSRAGVAA